VTLRHWRVFNGAPNGLGRARAIEICLSQKSTTAHRSIEQQFNGSQWRTLSVLTLPLAGEPLTLPLPGPGLRVNREPKATHFETKRRPDQ
jgi:hypothetical protein